MEAKAKEVAQSTHSAMSWHIQLNQHHKDVLDYVYKQKEKLGLTDKELHQRYSHADLNIAPSEPTPDDHYEVYHGTKMYAAESIQEEGFHMNGSEEDFGHAVYFKSPEYDQHDINDYNKWVQDREAQGFDMKHANAKSHGYDTHKIVNGFAGKSNESAVIKAFIPKKHVLDCTKGRPAELDELVNSFKNSYGTQKKVRALLKHWLGMDTEGMSDKEAAEAYSANKPKLEEKRGTKVILGSISPYEVYARKHGIGAIVDVLESYKDEGVQIGVYDPKLIQIKDVGKKLQRDDHKVGKVHLLKALAKAKAAGYCLLHHHIDEDGLHLYVGALGSSEVNKSLGYTKRSAYSVANPEEVIYIPTNRLRTVYQTEKATNWDKVKENAVRMLAGEHLEPVSIGLDYDVHDGHHRLEASRQLGHEHVPCIVKGGNELERQSAIEAYREVWKSLGKEAFEDDERYIYRGVGLRELHFIQKHGYIQSKGKGNNADQTNQFTCFSTRYGQAEGYARTNYDLYNEKQAFVIALPKPEWMKETDGEVAIRGQVSTEGMQVIPVPQEDIVKSLLKSFDEGKHPRDAQGKFALASKTREKLVEVVKRAKAVNFKKKTVHTGSVFGLEEKLEEVVRHLIKPVSDQKLDFDKDKALKVIADLKKLGFRREKSQDRDNDHQVHAAYAAEFRVNPDKALVLKVYIGKWKHNGKSISTVITCRYLSEAQAGQKKRRKQIFEKFYGKNQ